GNPLALDFLSQHELDFSFQDTHPGFGQELEQMVLSREIAGQARAYNRQRLESLRAADDAWLGHAYDQLAVGARLACVSAHPRASDLEALLLHLHPDDRLELSFHTFYSHSRAIDYRLIGVLASDLPGIERQFRGLESTRVDQPEPARRGGLGTLVCRNRQRDPSGYLDLVERFRLTYLSDRHFPQIRLEDAAFALDKAWDDPQQLTREERQRLRHLKRRSIGGLEDWIEELADCWAEPELFKQALDKAEQAVTKVGSQELESVFEDSTTYWETDQRWALASLLTRERAWVPGTLNERGRWQMARELLPAGALPEFIGGFSKHQAQIARPILRQWALADARFGDPRVDREPYWLTLLAWLHQREHRWGGAFDQIKNVLAARPSPADQLAAWQKLRSLCLEYGYDEESFDLLIQHELPLVPRKQVKGVIAKEVERVLQQQPERLPMLASSFGTSGVAAAVFHGLAESLALHPEDASRLVDALTHCLKAAPALDSGAAEELGGLLAELALLPPTLRVSVAETLDRSTLLVAERRPFANTALECAARSLVAQESKLLTMAPVQAVRAIRVVLQARNNPGGASGGTPDSSVTMEAALMRLAVLGKLIAARLPRDAQQAADELDRAWLLLLDAVREGHLFEQPPREARSWIHLLEQELGTVPRQAANDKQVKLSAFLDLAWSLWSRTPADDPYRAALASKLRRIARPLGGDTLAIKDRFSSGSVFRDPKKTHQEWHHRKIELRVPAAQRDQARSLIAPITFTFGNRVVEIMKGL
ncbi:MAG: hypothetical protein AAF560_33380, partial [Acidobacteriota bacterium]